MTRWTPVAVMGLLACATTLDPAVAEEPAVGCPETAQEPTIPDYDRRTWGRWIDADGDCQDTRQEVLIAGSRVEVTFETERKCRVSRGEWMGPYTGEVFTDPGLLDVDHMVALRDAHGSGAAGWSKDRKRDFANDLDNPFHLIAVSRSANRSKGSRGPDEWLPTNGAFRCTYLHEWVMVKENYSLSMGDGEAAVLAYMTKICDDGVAPPLPQ